MDDLSHLPYITYVLDRSDTYDNHTVVVLYQVPSNNIILPTLPPLYTGHSISICAQNGYVIIRLQLDYNYNPPVDHIR